MTGDPSHLCHPSISSGREGEGIRRGRWREKGSLGISVVIRVPENRKQLLIDGPREAKEKNLKKKKLAEDGSPLLTFHCLSLGLSSGCDGVGESEAEEAAQRTR